MSTANDVLRIPILDDANLSFKIGFHHVSNYVTGTA